MLFSQISFGKKTVNGAIHVDVAQPHIISVLGCVSMATLSAMVNNGRRTEDSELSCLSVSARKCGGG